jgi:hypothetical protein
MQPWAEQEMGEEILAGIVSMQAPCVAFIKKVSVK